MHDMENFSTIYRWISMAQKLLGQRLLAFLAPPG